MSEPVYLSAPSRASPTPPAWAGRTLISMAFVIAIAIVLALILTYCAKSGGGGAGGAAAGSGRPRRGGAAATVALAASGDHRGDCQGESRRHPDPAERPGHRHSAGHGERQTRASRAC